MQNRPSHPAYRTWRALVLTATGALACHGNPDRQTLAGLRAVEPDLSEVEVADGIDRAMAGYRSYLEEAPTSSLTPEAMRRLADLQLEKEYGIVADAKPRVVSTATASPVGRSSNPLVAPDSALPAPARTLADSQRSHSASAPAPGESLRDFEARATATTTLEATPTGSPLPLPGSAETAPSGPLEALALYDKILASYPDYAHNDQVLYQKARALDELGRVDEAIEVSALMVEKHPESRHLDEIQFRRGEYFFTRKKWLEAERAYAAIAAMGPTSEYYELGLYKLGWTYYKQMMLPEALGSYVALLDQRVATDYDFDQTADEASAQRIADSYRVMSLCFSDLGGAPAVESFFEDEGKRPYENRVYRHLAEFYFEKLRYQDAADTYESFVRRYPLHASSPHYGMRVVEIYQAADMPTLVLEAKKGFASRYALDAEYWRHFDPADSPDVIAYLKRNLEDLANHYHAQYQGAETPEERRLAFDESVSWYRRYLVSFAEAPETPGVHHRLADLLLENESFGPAATEYERIAYGYPAHERASAAGYAAIFAHRKHQEAAPAPEREAIRREAVASTIRFADRFPDHEHAATVLGVAIEDLFDLKEYRPAAELGHRLVSTYRDADQGIRRSAWLVIAHSSFELGEFGPAESAYAEVLDLTADSDESRGAIVDNLAASIYKQGEQAKEAGEFRAAADHYLRIAKVAPASGIRPIAEYDAGAALLALEDWEGALGVLEDFRASHPTHELHQEATQQIAQVHRAQGHVARAAQEYERVAREAEKPELRAESLLVAGELYEEAGEPTKALAAYREYVAEFEQPVETAVVTRARMAELYLGIGDGAARRDELEKIVELDRSAGDGRTDTIRATAARSALLLAEERFRTFDAIELRQPFERSLLEKQTRMNELLAALGALVDYRVGDVTAAATYYMAETYFDFSRSLLDSERPGDLSAADLSDYEGVLEEEAFPFEEKAIAVHEKNLELMRTGVYNGWIEKSLGHLAQRMPGRYAKPEESSGPLDSLSVYSYRSPAAPSAPAPETITEAQPGPATTDAAQIESEETPIPAATDATLEARPQEPVAPQVEVPASSDLAAPAPDEASAPPASPAPLDEEPIDAPAN